MLIGSGDATFRAFDEAIALRRKAGDLVGVVRASILRASARARIDPGRAIEELRALDEEHRAAIPAAHRGRILAGLGAALSETDRKEEEAGVWAEAIPLLETGDDRASLVFAKSLLARLRLRQGRTDEAKRILDSIGDLDPALDVGVRATASISIGIARLESGDPRGALDALRWVAGLWAFRASTVADQEAGRRGFRAERATGFLLACAMALPAGERAAEAFAAVESGRSIALAGALLQRDALLAARVPAEVRTAERASREEIRRALETLGSAAAGRGSAGSPALAEARSGLARAYARRTEAIARLGREVRATVEALSPVQIELATLRTALGADDAYLAWHVACGARSNRLVGLAVTRADAVAVDLGEAAPLLEKAAGWADLLSAPGSNETALATALYDALVRPLEPALGPARRWLVCPTGGMSLVPIAALRRTDGESARRVVERVEVVYVPSATVFARLKDSTRPRDGVGIVGVADPAPGPGGKALPASREEIDAILALHPATRRTRLVGDEATEAALRAALEHPGTRLAAVQIATHGVFDEARPRLSGLVLAKGERLLFDDVASWRVDADLVVLSGCDTAKGPMREGEGVLGFARAFFLAGCAAGRRLVVERGGRVHGLLHDGVPREDGEGRPGPGRGAARGPGGTGRGHGRGVAPEHVGRVPALGPPGLKSRETRGQLVGGTRVEGRSRSSSGPEVPMRLARPFALVVLALTSIPLPGCGGGGGGGGAPSQFPVGVTPQDLVAVGFVDATLLLPRLSLADVKGRGEVLVEDLVIADGGAIDDLVWSPDHARLAVLAQPDGVLDAILYVVEPLTGTVTPVSGPQPAGSYVERLDWSPDSSRLAFVRNGASVDTLSVVRPDGSGLVEVSGAIVAGGNVLDFAWSPDSSRIVFRADADVDDKDELYVVHRDGSGRVKVSGAIVAGGFLHDFRWSPDSSRLALSGGLDTNGATELFTVLADGAGGRARVHPSLPAGRDVRWFEWAPDASRLAYVADQTTDEIFELFSSLPDGTGNVPLSGTIVSGGDVEWDLFWAPDSTRVAFVADRLTDEVRELFTVPGVGGTAPIRVSGTLIADGDVGRILLRRGRDPLVTRLDAHRLRRRPGGGRRGAPLRDPRHHVGGDPRHADAGRARGDEPDPLGAGLHGTGLLLLPRGGDGDPGFRARRPLVPPRPDGQRSPVAQVRPALVRRRSSRVRSRRGRHARPYRPFLRPRDAIGGDRLHAQRAGVRLPPDRVAGRSGPRPGALLLPRERQHVPVGVGVVGDGLAPHARRGRREEARPRALEAPTRLREVVHAEVDLRGGELSWRDRHRRAPGVEPEAPPLVEPEPHATGPRHLDVDGDVRLDRPAEGRRVERLRSRDVLDGQDQQHRGRRHPPN